jgi:imidazolonepropionase-like amidohydrolase
MRPLLYLLLAFATATLAHAQPMPKAWTGEAPTGTVLVRGGTVLTVTGGTLENTDVLVEDGIITRIGQGLSAPSGARVIDASGLHVMPGIIDAHSHMATSSVNEATVPISAEVSIEDVLDPTDLSIYRALAGGVTAAHIMHGSANPIGGQNETIKLRWGYTHPDALRLEGAPRTIKFALGENPTRVHGSGNDIHPSTRMGVEMVIREAFTRAQRYAEDKRTAAAQGTPPPVYDARMEVLEDILAGEVLVHCHSYRSDEILMLMDVFEDFGIDHLTFQHVNEGFKVAPELAAFGSNGAGASIFSDWWAYKFEVYYSTAYNAAILVRNGVVTSINSDSEELIRHLYHEAAKSQKYGGLSDDEALALITINPARQLGIDDVTGSIEVGKAGDIAIFEGHPLSIYARPRMTLVDGVVYFDDAADPDDVRFVIDPEAEVADATIRFHEHDERCMEGAELTMMFANE